VPVDVDGARYLTAAEVAERAGVSRQTLWRWRQETKVPAGARYRDRQLLFSEAEAEAVEEYAHRLEPATPTGTAGQLRLFNGRQPGAR
jgi:predicted DNA-binding transcriptional regulator AlpA